MIAKEKQTSYVKIKEAAEITGKSEQTIRNWLRKGKIAGSKIDGRWQVDTSNLQPQKAAECKNDMHEIKEGIEEIKEILQGKKESQSDSQQLEALAKENAELKQQVAELQAKMTKLEELEKQVVELMQRQKAEQEQHSEPQKKQEPEKQTWVESKPSKKQYSKGLEDEGRAERWARNNPGEWLDVASGLELAREKTWRDLATNASGKIRIGGKEQKPRVYLHIIAKNQKVYGWHKVKAKVALELLEGEKIREYYDPEL